MSEDRDLSFDIDALFDHLVNDLEHDLAAEKDWHFSFRSSDVGALEKLADDLAEEFFVHIEENVEDVDADGNAAPGAPLMLVVCRGALSVDEVKELAERFQTIADKRELSYEGVSCYDPIDEQDLLGWMAPEDAVARLQHLSDLGLEENAALPWAFLVLAPSAESTEAIASDLAANGFEDRDDFDEPDDDGNFGMCVFVAGQNNEEMLEQTAAKISKTAEGHAGELYGIQFYTREDVIDIFGDDSDEEDSED